MNSFPHRQQSNNQRTKDGAAAAYAHTPASCHPQEQWDDSLDSSAWPSLPLCHASFSQDCASLALLIHLLLLLLPPSNSFYSPSHIRCSNQISWLYTLEGIINLLNFFVFSQSGCFAFVKICIKRRLLFLHGCTQWQGRDFSSKTLIGKVAATAKVSGGKKEN